MVDYCSPCQVFCQGKVQHCTRCDVCYEGLDHHCPWMGKCVAKKNICDFYGFLMVSFVSMIYAFMLNLYVLNYLEKKTGANQGK